MFDYTSRYYLIETAIYVTADGREVAYKRRRFLPLPESLPLLTEAVVAQGDRLDLIAARTLGVAEAFWRIADANADLNPSDLADEPGRRLRVPVPQP